MKSNKGFTLIELLAVIVVLAIIALIATPMVLNVIDEAKKGAAENSAYAYIHAVEMKIAMEMITDNTVGDVKVSTTNYASVKGDKPSSVNITFVDGVAQDGGTISYGSYNFKIESGKLVDATAKTE